jgi:AraC-like DNA-binding protein
METDQYVSTIGYNVGFNNIANFNRRFMEVKGMTPSEFRREGLIRYGHAAGVASTR